MDANNESVKQEETVQETKQDAPVQEQASETEVHAAAQGADVQDENKPEADPADGSDAQAAADAETADAAAEAGAASDAAQAEIEALQRQLEEHKQRLLRVQADYDNFRRRTRQEKEDLYKYAASDVIETLLPVLDNFDRALASAHNGNDYDALVKGIDMIFRQFKQVLEQAGLTAMNAVGQPFNPEYHEAVMKEESEDHEEGIVLEELQKGYMFKDKVLRPAMVKVSG